MPVFDGVPGGGHRGGCGGRGGGKGGAGPGNQMFLTVRIKENGGIFPNNVADGDDEQPNYDDPRIPSRGPGGRRRRR
jgi:hypothetical protein